jgi:hypothetical protein
MPLANPDETAYLVAARVLAGGPAADLSYSTLYPGGYPLLITPAYWFSSNPSTVYHAVMVINALISALVLPLGYLACRRLGLGRPAAYGVAFVAALVPAGFFYSEYAMTDAVFVVITLAWLLTTHSWLTASSARVRYANAAGSAALAAYAYAVHSRGLVMVAGLAAMGVVIGWRQAAARLSVLVAALTAVVVAAAGWALNHHISLLVYPGGQPQPVRPDPTAAGQRERHYPRARDGGRPAMAGGARQLGHRGHRPGRRAAGGRAPRRAERPADHGRAHCRGDHAHCLHRPGRAALRPGAGLGVRTLPGRHNRRVLPGRRRGAAPGQDAGHQNWTNASVALATAVTLVLLAVWVGFAFVLRRLRPGRVFTTVSAAFGVCVAAVSLVAVAQMTSHISQADGSNTQEAITLMETGKVRPGDQVAVAPSLGWMLMVPQAFEVSWTELKQFNPGRQPPPAGTTVVETGWPAGQPAQAGWLDAPAGWRIVASDQDVGWVVWRKG